MKGSCSKMAMMMITAFNHPGIITTWWCCFCGTSDVDETGGRGGAKLKQLAISFCKMQYQIQSGTSFFGGHRYVRLIFLYLDEIFLKNRKPGQLPGCNGA